MHPVDGFAISSALVHAVTDHEMVLVPVQYTGKQGILYKLSEGYLHTHCTESYGFCSIADSEHGHAFTGNEASLAEHFCRIFFPVVSGYHP